MATLAATRRALGAIRAPRIADGSAGKSRANRGSARGRRIGPHDAGTSAPDDLDAAIETVEGDPVDVKLELARAYIDIGDTDSASEVLKEVSEQGNPDQRAAAAELLLRL